MKKIIKIKGLDCAHCASKLEEIIKKTEGITDAKVNFLLEKAIINYESDAALELALNNGKKSFPECEFK